VKRAICGRSRDVYDMAMSTLKALALLGALASQTTLIVAEAKASTDRDGPLPSLHFKNSAACVAELSRMHRSPNRFDTEWAATRLVRRGPVLEGTITRPGFFWRKRVQCVGPSMARWLTVSQSSVCGPLKVEIAGPSGKAKTIVQNVCS
jgi:hypothetical protein